MKKNEHGFGLIEFIAAGAILLALGLSGWFILHRSNKSSTPSNTAQSQNKSCIDIKNHSMRAECYSNDNDAQLLLKAINENDPALCENIEHVFTPHDVTNDIKKGIIGSLIYGDEAKQACRDYVQRGHGPRSG